MKLKDFKSFLYGNYIDQEYEIQQKAYLLFWGCCWMSISGLGFLIYTIVRTFIIHDVSISTLTVGHFFGHFVFFFSGLLGAISVWKKQYNLVAKVLSFIFILTLIILFVFSLERFTKTGISTHREIFYIGFVWIALFLGRKSLLVIATIIISGSIILMIDFKSDINFEVNFFASMTLMNGTFCMIATSIILYLYCLINDKALHRVRVELAKNKELSNNLDQKVKSRTQELKQKNLTLQNIEYSLKRYLPKQLVDSIKERGKESMDSVSVHRRKKMTFFFSDIKNFTIITDSLEPEDMANLLNEYLTEMNEIIDKYEGTLAQVIGDGLYVFFGAPKSTNDTDHAIRCMNMAIEMQNKMDELNKRWFDAGIDEKFQIRCGINTGMATVGGYGSSNRKEYTAMGMQVNIAARIEAACTPGNILLSHSTWSLVKDNVQCKRLEKIEIKGYHKPIKIYEVEEVPS